MLLPGMAHAEQVTCGETIIEDTKLDNDLIDCPRKGLVIGADNITLDLNGHTVDGTVNPYCYPGEEGVLSVDHNNVTIKNGTVQQFCNGVAFSAFIRGPRLVGARASNLRVTDSGIGLRLFHAQGASFESNTLSDNHYGIFLEDDGAQPSEELLWNRITRNRIVNSAPNDPVNNESRNGITMYTTYRNLVARNVISRAPVGIATAVDGSLHNRFVGNTVRDGSEGLLVGDDDNVLKGNFAHSMSNYGFVLGDGTSAIRNVASGNAMDGFVAASGSIVRKNRAYDNANFGIRGEPGVIDGGGNRAFGNGNPLQCLYVVCKSNGGKDHDGDI